MSSGAQKLLADYEQIQKLLEQYPNIKIIETEGDPPERYDIEYSIKGYKTNIDGSPVPINVHRVSITLPFGYPHFPPTAKPLSSIFHPDIDPDAIRIADFWQENKSLADLILHIGEMICGMQVNKGEPFNQSAADWYEERKSWLPFDTLEPSELEERQKDEEVINLTEPQEEQPEPPKPTIPTEPKSRSGKPLDILKEDFDFDFDDEELFGPGESIEKEGDTAPSAEDDVQDETDYEIDLTEEAEDDEDDVSLDFILEDETDLTADLEEDIDDLFSIEEEESPLEFEVEKESEDSADLGAEDSSIDFNLEEDLGSAATADTEEELDSQIDDTSSLEFNLEEDLESSATADAEEELDSQVEDTSSIEFNLEEDLDSSATADTEEQLVSQVDDTSSIEFNLEVEDESELTEPTSEPEETTIDSLETEGGFTGLSEEPLEGLDLLEEELTDQETPDGSDMSLPVEEEFSGLDDESLSGLDLSEEEPPVIPEAQTTGGEAGSVKPLIEKKEIFTAKKVLSDIPDPGSIPNFKELEKEISEAISEAEELYKKADALEQKGELEKAGLMLDLVANIATDYPGLEFARNRIRETMIAGGGKKEGEEGEGEVKGKKSRKVKINIPYKLIASALLIVGLAGGGTGVYLRDSDNIRIASTNYQKAEELLEKKEYKSADQSLKKSQAALDTILFLQKEKKEQIQKKITAITSSESFKEGLQGRVLYDGKYVTVEMAKNIDKFIALKTSAEVQQNSNNINKAIELYEQAIPAAEKIGFDEEAQTIAQTINNLKLNRTLDQARKSEDEKEWKQAADTYAKALELSKNLSTADNKNEIASRLASATFRHELDQSKRAFTASEWQKTIEMLQRALSILEANPEIAPEDEKTELNKLLVNSQLYHLLSKAKKAFEMKEWELAVTEYKKAINLLETNTDILGEEVTDSVGKIEKTILMTQIAREQELSNKTINDNDLTATRKHYLAIVSLIEASSFSDDETLKKILDNARKQSVTLEKEIVINSRIDWLNENYEDIFRKNYPSAQHSELLKPKATFIKKEGKILIFTMSCVEKKQGRAFRLELNYQYDQDADKWSIYSGKL